MTEPSTEGGGTPLSFKKVDDPSHFERAPAPRAPARESGDPNMAFEAAPRAPIAPSTVPDPRTMRSGPPPPPAGGAVTPAPPAGPPPRTGPQAFEAVPASLGVAQGRLATPTVSVRPVPAPPSEPVRPGGSGWNVRTRDGAFLPNRAGGGTGEGSAWQTRPLPGAERDRSAWSVPEAPHRRTLTGKALLRIVLSVILVAILGFAGYE
jgi:hypothetical protein